MEIFSQGLGKPLAREREKLCEYSTRGAKSQLIFSHSTDQGKITKQLLPQGKFVVIEKVKATHIPPLNQSVSFPAEESPRFALRLKP